MENKKKGSWDKDNLKTALDKVLSKKMGLREAALKYSIPKSTLHDKITCLKSGEEIALQPKLGRFTKTFLPEYEEQLLNHVKDLSNRCLPLMKKEFLKLAYDLAVELKLPHRFNTEKRTAGKHFYYDFMARHPDLSLRTPESTSMMRAVGFNKPQVDLFFSNLEKLMNQYNFPPSNIYNCDETGVSCVQKHQKVLAPKAVRQVGKLTSAPFFIFPRMKMNERLMINAPSQSEGVAQPKGWMNSDFFCQWLKHFEKFSHPSKESPVLLLHERCDMWMRANAGARITDYDIAGLVGEAFTKVARLDIAVSGFKCTGIYPFDKNIFSDIDYLPSDMTNVPLEEIRTQTAPVASKVLDAVPVRDTQMTKEIHPSTSSVPDISKNLLKLSPFPDA